MSTDNRAAENAEAWLYRIQELTEMLSDLETEDQTTQEILECPLSIQLSGTWDNGSKPKADAFTILLSWGGPACRIKGDICDGCVWDAELQYQDWGTDWVTFCGRESGKDYAALMTFVNQFYFEGV